MPSVRGMPRRRVGGEGDGLSGVETFDVAGDNRCSDRVCGDIIWVLDVGDICINFLL